METIGERAAKSIRERAALNGTSLRKECAKLDMQIRVFWGWHYGQANPSAYFLQQMALAGYDVMYILTGKEKANEN